MVSAILRSVEDAARDEKANFMLAIREAAKMDACIDEIYDRSKKVFGCYESQVEA